MPEIKNVSSVVKTILKENKQSRNDDNYLYYLVLKHYGIMNGIDISGVTVPDLLIGLKGFFPPFETVRRARQKIQSAFPELCACDRVEEFRAINEEKFRAYAKSFSV